MHYSQVAEIIAKSNLITLPSFAEAFPMTWLEAMAMGKAMVTSNIGWANEMMEDGITGYMINPKDHKDYANKMRTLLEKSNFAKECGTKAYERLVDHFEISKIVIKNIDFYRLIINKK